MYLLRIYVSCLFRYNALSLVYLLYLLLLPWFLWPNKHTLRGHTGRFIKALFSTSLLFVLAHVCFQICLYTVPGLDNELGHNCECLQITDPLPLDEPWTVVRLLAPDLGVFIISLITMVLCNRLVKSREEGSTAQNSTANQEESGTDEEEEEEDDEDGEEDEDDEEDGRQSSSALEEESGRAALLAARLRATAQRFLRNIGRLLAVTLLALAGITLPSAFSSVYFLLFIGVCTWWACHFPISHLGFNALCVMVSFFTAGHLVCLYLYQSDLAQTIFTPDSLWARLFGLKDIIIPANCSSSDALILNTEHDWPVYVNPGILLLLYITVATILKISTHSYSEVPPNTHFTLCTVVVKSLHTLVKKHNTAVNSHKFIATSATINSSTQTHSPCLLAVWSITYHSWLTFVLLLWACLIWMLRARRHFAMLCSPFILLYGLGLCCLQYVWAMHLEPELPQHVGYMSLRQMGLDRATYPCLRLGAMLLFTLTFWLLLRQSVKDIFWRKKKQTAPLQEVTTGENTGRDDSILKLLGRVVMSLYAKYWIYVCGGMFIMVSFAGKLVGYKIVYMLLFLLCMCLYQVYYSLWRRLLKPFWWLVVAYTMLVLIAIYTYQFEDFPDYWRNFTGFTEEQLSDIGLETFKLSELFTSIMIPGFFLLACILQLHYFHKPFMKITDLEHVTPLHSSEGGGFEEEDLQTDLGDDESEDGVMVPSKWGLVMDRLMVLFRKFSDILTLIQAFLWRILELHILKIVAFFVVWVALLEPSVMNLVLVVLWSFAMPYARFRPMASCLSTVWVCVIIVCKMLYQLSIVNPNEYSNNFNDHLEMNEIVNSTLYKDPVDPANWFGFRKAATALGYSKNHLLVLLLLVFEATVYRHQVHHYRQLQRSPPTIPAIFPQATRDKLDQGLLPCIKYLLNYSFYKPGVSKLFLLAVRRRNIFEVLVFRYMFWFVLAVVFVTGSTRISVFGLGYLLASFFFLLFGTRLLIKRSCTRLLMWDCLIIYNVTVIISKNILSILACVFVADMQARFCWVIQLFSLVCTVKDYYNPASLNDKECSLPVEEAGIIWDSICFFFLLLQRRVFLSFYFLHVTADLQASARQASRGFELFRASIIKNMRFHKQAEKKSIQQLKNSMQRIRDKQQKYKEGRKPSEREEQPTESQEELERKQRKERKTSKHKEWHRPWIDHATVLHSGDYYLFESDSGEEEDFSMGEQKQPKQTAFQLAYQAWVSSAKHALRERQRRQREQRLERERQQAGSQASGGKYVFTALYVQVAVLRNCDAVPGTRSDTVQRILDILKFLWVLFLAMVDGFTLWLSMLTKQYVDTSTVLSEERYMLIHNIDQTSTREPMDDQLSQGSESPTLETCLDETDTDANISGAVSSAELEEISELDGAQGHSSTTLSSHPTLQLEPDSRTLRRQRRSRTKHSAAADIASTLSEDQVPEAFLVMLLIQFSTMVIDRALYLRKAVLGKLIFQIILVFGIHLWMFFILPAVTERMFNQNFVAQLWYFVKCIYFTLSAYQVRCGYPTRILGNFLTKKYNHLNLFLFQGFRLVPFLVELRAVMDWVWTDTTLSLSNWMCVEDIYANIFIIKCSRETEKKYPQPKGQKKKKIVKYGMGGLIVFFLICIIWFPLLFISLVRSVVGVVNHPVDVTVTVKLGGYEPLFTMSVQQQSIQPFTEANYNHLTELFGSNAVAMQFITLYSYEDIVTANIEGSSGSVWRISPPSRQEVIKELLGSPADMTLRLAWNFQRDLNKGGTVENTFDKHSINLEPGNPVRADLASLLVGNRTEPVRVPHMFPNYIRAPNGAEAKPVSQLYEGDEEGYQNVTLSLMRDGSLNGSGAQEWWDISVADCDQSSGACGVLPMIIFNDKVSPPSLGFLAGYGIMGLYVSVVLVIGKFVRGFFSEISHSIMFEELPCVDRILKLCTDIFLVRETGELELEEELYSKLIFLYRSPETMIKWTREKNKD
uniref:Piezo-type mechanosensitive ion channel component 1 n=1 Tax=Astyanax mexicanus TaxID=7994 RepID=A0A8B9GV46_ASTMX